MIRLQKYSNRLGPAWTTLKKIGTSLKGVLFLSPADARISFKKTLCLVIEKGEIKAAVGSRFLSRIKVKGFKKYQSPEPDYPTPPFLASSAALAVAEFGAEKCPITLSIPKAWAIIKTVDYPSSVLENLSEVMAHELDRITPFTPESAYFDFKILREEAGRVFILVAAARSDLIDPYLKALREKELTIEGITVNLLGLSSLCRYGRKERLALFVQLDKDQYEGILFKSEASFEVFSGYFTQESEKAKIEQIEKEIESRLPFLNQKDLGGEFIFYLKDKSPTLKEMIKRQMQLSITFLDETALGIGPLGTDRKQIPYAAIGGILGTLWTKSWRLNLFLKGLHRRSKPPWVVSLLLILALGVLVGIYWITPVEIETKRLHSIDRQIASKKMEVKKIENLKKEIESISGEISLINDFKQSNLLGLNILKDLTQVLPREVWLTRVRIFESQVNIEGYAPSATLLIPRLEGSKSFKKVEFASPTFNDPRQKMDRFQIKMEIKKPELENRNLPPKAIGYRQEAIGKEKS
jgi:Tfp pilus assembly protein PilN